MTAFRYPDSHVFYRKLTRDFPRIVRGEGCYLYDEGGTRYLDACGGAFVVNLGHANSEIAEAIGRQARQFGYLSGTAFTHEPVEQLAAELAVTLPGDLDKLYFLSSGSEAVEAALKLARQYWVERGLPHKHRIIALAPAYHGNTLLALSASAREQPSLSMTIAVLTLRPAAAMARPAAETVRRSGPVSATISRSSRTRLASDHAVPNATARPAGGAA